MYEISAFNIPFSLCFKIVNNKESIESIAEATPKRGTAFQITVNTSTTRKSSPTSLDYKGELNLPRRSAHRRQLETLLASAEINGGSVENRKPALDGMFATILKYGNIDDVAQYISTPGKMKKSYSRLVKNQAKEYENSEDNFIRSLSLLYAGGIIAKHKYEQIRSALVMKNTGKKTKKGNLSKERIRFGLGVPIPKPLPYSALIDRIQQLDIGKVISLSETICIDLPEDEKVNGVFRDLEQLLLALSKFYIETDPFRKESDQLIWFGERKGSFKVALGGDGAPFGKWDESMSWLVSFLNVGSRIASPNDNFLLFGANCKEEHKVVELFTKQLMNDMEKIESKSYTVLDIEVTFSFELVPSDMKFTAFLNGELNNAATYFSSFANVSQSDSSSLGKQFGTSPSCKWKPWRYEERIKVAKQVAGFKKGLSSKVTAKTNRSKVTKFIADKHSRQEFIPRLGKFCDKAVLEPLHLKNNAVQHLHRLLLRVLISISSLPANLSKISDLPHSCPMTRYLEAMENEVKAGRLKKQLSKWLIDDRLRDKDFSYRFTGKDSKLILHGFMYLIDATRGDSGDLKLLAKLLFLSLTAVKLRDCIAYFSMYSLSRENLLKLPSLAHDYFTAIVLFGGKCNVSATVWSIGHLVAVHSQWVFDKYGTGLGINTMQGREAKHVQIASYAKHSQYRQRWFHVFRHDYISKLWLPSHQPSLLGYHKIQDSLIPPRVRTDRLHYCYCGFNKEANQEMCFYCSHDLMIEIKKSVAESKPTKVCLKYMS